MATKVTNVSGSETMTIVYKVEGVDNEMAARRVAIARANDKHPGLTVVTSVEPAHFGEGYLVHLTITNTLYD